MAAIRRLANADSRVKTIVNNRNFGIIHSSNQSLLQARGDAIISMAGFALSAVSLLIALGYLIYKLAGWEQMSFGMAPILIGFFFFAFVQLFFIGLLGEYILHIHTQVQRRPMVMERERINFSTGEK